MSNFFNSDIFRRMNYKNIILIGILAVLGFSIYTFNLKNPLFWDDDDWIINNVYVHDITWDNVKFWLTNNTLAGVGLKSNYYRPFLFFTFALNWIISETKPLVWHLTSNLIHIANGLLVFSILHLLFRKKLAAFLTALIFIIHPLQTEAVTYISGRGDLLVVFFMLLILRFFVARAPLALQGAPLQYLPTPNGTAKLTTEQASQGGKLRLIMSRYYWPLSIGLLILALLSRETAIIFPFLAMLVLMALSQEKFLASLKKSFIKTLPFFAVVMVYGILRLTVLNFQNTLNFYSTANIYSENLMVRLYTFGGALIEYVKLLFIPVGLHMERSSVVYTSITQWPVWGVLLVLLALVGWLVYLYRKERGQRSKFPMSNSPLPIKSEMPNVKNENPKEGWKLNIGNWKFLKISDFRVWFFGVGWFFIGLAPVSGITPINAVIYEHWLYLPMVGFWSIIAFYLAGGLNYFKENKKPLFAICILLFGAYLSFYIIQSIKRNILWGKPIEFYKNILRYEPNSTRVNNNLGNLYFNQKDLARAKEYYEKAAEGDSDFAQPHFNLGSVLESEGDIFGAIKEYEKAIEINPHFYYAHQNLMALYAKRGDLDKAIGYVETLKKIKPQDPRVFYNAALLYAARNDKAAVIENLRAGLLVADPDPYAKKLIEELLVKLSR